MEKQDIPTNHLFHEMIRVIERIQPRAFLFENVQGLPSSKWRSSGEKGEIFRDSLLFDRGLCDATHSHSCLLLLGVPQNRPRVSHHGGQGGTLYSTASSPLLPTYSGQTLQQELRNNGGLFPLARGSTALGVKEAIGDLEYDVTGTEEEPLSQESALKDFQRMMRLGLGSDPLRQTLTDHVVSNHSKRVRERVSS